IVDKNENSDTKLYTIATDNKMIIVL
ncbi:MAG: hypothetical protein RL108_788, partial [Bacteroidota bacterium]